jgi:hypothetical protein
MRKRIAKIWDNVLHWVICGILGLEVLLGGVLIGLISTIVLSLIIGLVIFICWLITKLFVLFIF